MAQGDHRWPDIADDVSDQLVRQEGLQLARWIELLSEVGEHLLPALKRSAFDESLPAGTRLKAAEALSEFARDDQSLLCDLLARANVDPYPPLWNGLLGDRGRDGVSDAAIARLEFLVNESADAEMSENRRVNNGRIKAGAAITLMRLGHAREAWNVFRFTDDPEAVSQFIDGYDARSESPQPLLTALGMASDPKQRYGLLLTLGSLKQVDDNTKQETLKLVAPWYKHAFLPDSGTHAAVRSVLEGWGMNESLPAFAAPTRGRQGEHDWFVVPIDSLGWELTFVTFEPGPFPKGALPSDPDRRFGEEQATGIIDQRYAVCNHEVTVGEFRVFVEEVLPELLPDLEKYVVRVYGLGDEDPMIFVRWHEAVLFCRWLTEKVNGVEDDQVYFAPLTIDRGDDPGGYDWIKYGDTPEQVAKYDLLKEDYSSKSGFRLPTEDEWECACRSGQIVTRFSFGSDNELLPHYAVADSASTKDVASLRPNLRGLFDMHGNVREWCQGWNNRKQDLRPLRGGGWEGPTRQSRCARRSSDLPDDQDAGNGFRLVISLPE